MGRLFASAAGTVAVNTVPAESIRQWLQAGQAVLIDVREAEEHAYEHIPGAINLPLSVFAASKLPPLPEGAKLVFHCRSGQRCGLAASKAVVDGFTGEINRMAGGIFGWKAAGGAVEGLIDEVRLVV